MAARRPGPTGTHGPGRQEPHGPGRAAPGDARRPEGAGGGGRPTAPGPRSRCPGRPRYGTHRTEDELLVERAFREGRRRTIREARELAGPRPGRSRCPRPNGPSPTRRAESCPPSAPRAASSQAIPAKPWSMRRHRSSSPPPCRKPRRTSPTRSRGCSRRSPIRARAPRPPGLAAGCVREDPGRALTAVGGMPRIPRAAARTNGYARRPRAAGRPRGSRWLIAGAARGAPSRGDAGTPNEPPRSSRSSVR